MEPDDIINKVSLSELLNGPNGRFIIIISAVVLLCIVGAILFLALRKDITTPIIKTNGPSNKKDKEDDKEKDESKNSQNQTVSVNVGTLTPQVNNIGPNTSPASQTTIQMTAKAFKTLINACDNIYDDHYKRREDLKNQLNKIMIHEQDECIRRVIGTLQLGYSAEIDDSTNERLDESTKVLDLYLQVDLNNILKDEFEKIRAVDRFEFYTPEDVSENIARVTDNCILGMKLKIRRYIIINKEIFEKLFDNKITELKENISNVIRKYVSASKAEAIEIENEICEKNKILEEELKRHIEVA
jgi:septum formation topological specificity factor MinE